MNANIYLQNDFGFNGERKVEEHLYFAIIRRLSVRSPWHPVGENEGKDVKIGQ